MTVTAVGALNAHGSSFKQSTLGNDSFSKLNDDALYAVFERCDLSALTALSQVNQRARTQVFHLVKNRWRDETWKTQLINAVFADDSKALHFAQRIGKKIDDIDIEGETLMSKALTLNLRKASYVALLGMMRDVDAPIVRAPDKARGMSGVMYGAIRFRSPGAIAAIAECKNYRQMQHPMFRACYLHDVVRSGSVACLKALIESGRFDVNRIYRGQSVLRCALSQPGPNLTVLQYLLSLQDIDVHVGDLPAAPQGVDPEKYRFYLTDPRVDINRVCGASGHPSEHTALGAAIRYALLYNEHSIFDIIVSDARLDVRGRCVRFGDIYLSAEAMLEQISLSAYPTEMQKMVVYLQRRLDAHPGYQKQK